MLTSKIYIYLAIAIVVVLGGGAYYYKAYYEGKKAVVIEQERKLNTIKDKTNAAKTDALTTPDPKSELRKYTRPSD